MPELSQQEKEIVNEIQQGRALRELVQFPGWKLVLDLMEKRVTTAEFHLINYDGTEPMVMMGLQKRARAVREFFQETQKEILSQIAIASEMDETLMTAATQVGEAQNF